VEDRQGIEYVTAFREEIRCMINEDTIQSNLFSKDIEEELKLIKLIILQINKHHEKIKITELTDIQKEIFKELKIKLELLFE